MAFTGLVDDTESNRCLDWSDGGGFGGETAARDTVKKRTMRNLGEGRGEKKMENTIYVRLKQVSRQFGETCVLEEVSLELKKGKIYGIAETTDREKPC